MELMTDLVNNQLTLYIPVAIVLIGAVLLFAFGFKSAEQPPFDKLSSGTIDERKSVSKKRKIKEKKTTANGHIVSESKSEKTVNKEKESKKSPSKEVSDSPKYQKDKKQDAGSPKQSEKSKKVETPKARKSEDEKTKKNIKGKTQQKPTDFDEGDWETVPTKNEKKKKPQDSPVKKEKKVMKKVDKPVEIEKYVKEEINKQLQESIADKEIKVETPDIEPANEEIEQIVAVTIEVKKEKSEKKPKKEKVEILEKPQIISEVISESKEKIVELSENQPPPAKAAQGGAIVFDELGDVWTEAKAAKKSKKKARRDN